MMGDRSHCGSGWMCPGDGVLGVVVDEGGGRDPIPPGGDFSGGGAPECLKRQQEATRALNVVSKT